MLRKALIGKDHKLELHEFRKTRRFEIKWFDLEDGEWVCNANCKLRTYDYINAISELNRERAMLEADGWVCLEIISR